MSDTMTKIYCSTYFQDHSNLQKKSTQRRNNYMTKKRINKKNR
ncbi:MAG: hypothetical protein RCH30_1870 [Candidatus Phytoplasma australasiaticum]|nr:hypothetical protein [Candidatus Phytoplasma australasiaticum]QLL36983.1 hypothetical protein EPWB_v2c3990 ['Echinacea purpurea' witches'-broom phytoplasma]WEX20297.1 MAG: hypothetical protein TB2022_2010 [Candidatus Phytoplasma aurantifolia]WKV64234.1 MAG: hypothetical protein NCHU2022_c4000 [Candidatus Phytoplasma australasiaticum]WMW50080.1 MAG: hypothetical protein RCH30_1870 [Candidatus Phytoplasma australasiaticum]